MAFQRPTVKEIIERIRNDAESRYGSKVPRRSLLSVFSMVLVCAGAVHSLYGYIEYISRQIFADSAEGKYLERRASEYGIYRRKATQAEGEVTFSGSETIPAGTLLKSENEISYETTGPADQAGVAKIQAVEAGTSGNLPTGSTLTLVSPLAGIETEAVAGEISGGTDEEDDESLRGWLLYRMRNPPKAATKTDYVAWAKEVSGVTRAWCYPLELGPGHVSVRFMTDGLTENGIPTDILVQRVKEHIETLMPVTTILQVLAPVPKKLDVTVDIIPETPIIRTKVESALKEIIRSEAEPGGRVLYSSLDRAVGSVEEITSYRLISPTDDVTAGTGEILIPGEVTFR